MNNDNRYHLSRMILIKLFYVIPAEAVIEAKLSFKGPKKFPLLERVN